MLARAQRMTSGQEFGAVIRRGHRAGSKTLVVHVLTGDGSSEACRAGLVVGRAVGNAVQRNQVKRRLRPLLRERLPALPGGTLVVVRALAAARGSSSLVLRADLERALTRALRTRGAA